MNEPPSLNEVLAAYGLTHRRCGGESSQAHKVTDVAGVIRFRGTCSEVWAWVNTFDTLSHDELADCADGLLTPEQERIVVVKLHVEPHHATFRRFFPDAYDLHFSGGCPCQ